MHYLRYKFNISNYKQRHFIRHFVNDVNSFFSFSLFSFLFFLPIPLKRFKNVDFENITKQKYKGFGLYLISI